MPGTNNEIITTDLITQNIDFTERFAQSIQTLIRILGVSRLQPLPVGSQVKFYKSTLTLADGDGVVAEGAVIPLSHVKRELVDTKELAYRKFRKKTSAEAIQSAGYKQAVTDTDTKLLREVQNSIKLNLVDSLDTQNATMTSGATFQKAIAAALGQLAVKWEDYDIQTVLFINPLDYYEYLGNADITLQTTFGMQYIQNFMGFNTVIMTSTVTRGKIIATASQNLNYVYASINGEMGSAMQYTADQTGLIGIKHSVQDETATIQTVILLGGMLFAEQADGVVIAHISETTDPIPTANNTNNEIRSWLLRHNVSSSDLTGFNKDSLLSKVTSVSTSESTSESLANSQSQNGVG
ncbi:hypothetical protein [Ligilactobacillus equi]|uniref:Phage protein n=1 Tax=Ligilactobacillus equi DPC 6820 TaxID=1392007 RepID=V7HW75_9LACO|nr:hypothetical protein [Ligilactobacillus equi]ETA74157.1 phage protein [Ligilactobacillus equi DPC 6820]